MVLNGMNLKCPHHKKPATANACHREKPANRNLRLVLADAREGLLGLYS
jgi:hypothetical protein